jgi:hypothetical protein
MGTNNNVDILTAFTKVVCCTVATHVSHSSNGLPTRLADDTTPACGKPTVLVITTACAPGVHSAVTPKNILKGGFIKDNLSSHLSVSKAEHTGFHKILQPQVLAVDPL